jgi:hypothetical protein
MCHEVDQNFIKIVLGITKLMEEKGYTDSIVIS